MPLTPATTTEALAVLVRRRMTRVETGYPRTYVGVIPENKEPIVVCTQRTREGWLAQGLIVAVPAPKRPRCNHMFRLTKAGRAAIA